jgi:hypothetical protein
MPTIFLLVAYLSQYGFRSRPVLCCPVPLAQRARPVSSIHVCKIDSKKVNDDKRRY